MVANPATSPRIDHAGQDVEQSRQRRDRIGYRQRGEVGADGMDRRGRRRGHGSLKMIGLA